jgi:hypothetical protein
MKNMMGSQAQHLDTADMRLLHSAHAKQKPQRVVNQMKMSGVGKRLMAGRKRSRPPR